MAHPSQHNLPLMIHGAIFECSAATRDECLDRGLFGLPRYQWKAFVSKITEHTVVFLYCFSDKALHGIFQPRSPPGFEIVRDAWTRRGGKTAYPAQLRVKRRPHVGPASRNVLSATVHRAFTSTSNPKSRIRVAHQLDRRATAALVQLFEGYDAAPAPVAAPAAAPAPERAAAESLLRQSGGTATASSVPSLETCSKSLPVSNAYAAVEAAAPKACNIEEEEDEDEEFSSDKDGEDEDDSEDEDATMDKRTLAPLSSTTLRINHQRTLALASAKERSEKRRVERQMREAALHSAQLRHKEHKPPPTPHPWGGRARSAIMELEPFLAQLEGRIIATRSLHLHGGAVSLLASAGVDEAVVERGEEEDAVATAIERRSCAVCKVELLRDSFSVTHWDLAVMENQKWGGICACCIVVQQVCAGLVTLIGGKKGKPWRKKKRKSGERRRIERRKKKAKGEKKEDAPLLPPLPPPRAVLPPLPQPTTAAASMAIAMATASELAGGAVTAMARARAVADTATARETATAAMSSDRRRGPAIPPVEWAKMTRSQRKHYMKNHKVKR